MDQFDFSYRDEFIKSLSCLVHNHQAFAYKCVKLYLFPFSHQIGFQFFFSFENHIFQKNITKHIFKKKNYF
jgi:hypothetical protein